MVRVNKEKILLSMCALLTKNSEFFIIGLTILIYLLVIEIGIGWLVLEQRSFSLSLFAAGIVKVILIVIIEEIVFRGYYLQKIAQSEKQWVPVLLSSILWSGLHIPNMVNSGLPIVPIIIGMGSFTVFGIALGLAFRYSGKSLWPPWEFTLGIISLLV